MCVCVCVLLYHACEEEGIKYSQLYGGQRMVAYYTVAESDQDQKKNEDYHLNSDDPVL